MNDMRFLRAGVMLIMLVLASAAFAQSRREGGSGAANASEPLQQTVAMLTAEAEAILTGEREMPEMADFAPRAPQGLSPEEAVQATSLRRVHRDAFADAYIRWQLAHFAGALPALDHESFRLLVQNMPKLLENPQARQEAVQPFERAAAAGKLNPRDIQQAQELWNAIEAESKRVERLNAAAAGYHKWVQEQLEGHGAQAHIWRLATCYAIIEAGWPTRAIKTEITRSLGEFAEIVKLSEEQRHQIVLAIRTLEGKERKFISAVAITAQGEVNVTISRAAVSKDNATKWIERVNGEE